MELGFEVRRNIIMTSLVIENFTSGFLAMLLGIKDIKKSKILGNKGGCLSFNQKIDMLIEIGALDASTRSKFQSFMEIRNQFVHNIAATTYEKCYAFTNGTDKYILKTYPQPNNISREEQLKKATKKLGDDITKITFKITEKVKEKISKEVKSEYDQKSEKAFKDAISQLKSILDDFGDTEIAKSPTFNSKRFKGLGTQIEGIFMRLYYKNMNIKGGK